jgi:four helix bundle suffix protein
MPEQPNQPASDGLDRSDRSEGDHPRRLRPSGGYRKLRSYQVATIIYDGTVSFCNRFVDKRSRTHDQMVQAARSGGKNIAEGSRAAATTSQTELRLVNVARASLEELLLDYEDYLRQHGHRQWDKNDPEALAVRAVGRQSDQSDQSDQPDRSDPVAHWQAYARWLEHADPAVVANTLICLIHQTNYLLDQQISALERDFVHEGGYSEQLAAARIAERQKQREHQTAPRPAAPACPQCGKPLILRTARKGPRAGSQFWGCSGYPECKGVRPLEASDGSDRSDRLKQGNP